MKNVKINFEGRDEGCAFFALYAGLRMYNEYKHKQHLGKDSFSTAGAEAYSMMEDLRYSHPEQYEEAKKEYDSELKNLFIARVVVSDEEVLTEHNTNVVSQFMEHCRENGITINDRMFETFFNA